MNLKEYQGKELFQENGLEIPDSFLITGPDQIKEIKGDVVLKAQVLHGKRGKGGLIIFAGPDDVKEKAEQLFKKGVREVLVEEKLSAEKEYYFSITIDRLERKPLLIFSSEGGMDIEELSRKFPDKIKKFLVREDFSPEKISKETGLDISFIEKAYHIFKKYEAELIEINPLALTKKGLVALDAKVVIDNNALFRQEFKKDENLTKIEREAKENGLSYVELEGDIGIIGNGAGLVMSTLDMVNYYGGKVANFLDVGGGADKEKMEKSIKLVLEKKPKGIFINIFGGITRCDEIARGLVDYKDKKSLDLPLVVRMIGTNEHEAKDILEKKGIYFIDSMEDGAKKIVELVK